MPFTRELWIERDDFKDDAPKGWFRLSPGKEVRLRYAYCITCKEVRRDANGVAIELVCTYDPESAAGKTSDGRKVKGIVHWVSASHAIEAPVRLYDHLFAAEFPDDVAEGVDWKTNLNPHSREDVRGAKLEPSLRDALPGQQFQFERVGYFVADAVESRAGAPVFNRTVTLKDGWAKIEKRAQ